MAEVVSIDSVLTWPDVFSKYHIEKMKAVLEKQGQIEPLQVRRIRPPQSTSHELSTGKKFQIFHADAWGNEIVQAARELGWTTILVVEMVRYER